jgi:hypothetical protein
MDIFMPIVSGPFLKQDEESYHAVCDYGSGALLWIPHVIPHGSVVISTGGRDFSESTERKDFSPDFRRGRDDRIVKFGPRPINRLIVVSTSVIPAEAKRRAGIQCPFWMPDQVRHDDTIMRRLITLALSAQASAMDRGAGIPKELIAVRL